MTLEILDFDQVDGDLHHQVNALYHQLDDSIKQLEVNQVLRNNGNLVFALCRKEDKVLGIALMATYKVISGFKGMIEDVVVDQEHRGKGIGRQLMEKLLEEAHTLNLDEVLLFSAHHRTTAISLYKSLGFKLKDSGLYRLILS